MLSQAGEAAASDGQGAEAAARLRQIQETAREGLAEARALVGSMTPPALEGDGLPDALERLVDRFGRDTGIAASFVLDGVPGQLSATSDVAALRATQEALANVRKHAAARTVSVRVERHGAGVVASVEDDGVGFTQPPAPDGLRFGLHVMAERASLAGGHLDVGPRPGGGTRVRVVLPEPVTAPAGRRRAP